MINEDLFERIVDILLEIAQTPRDWARARDAGEEERDVHKAQGSPKRTQSHLLQRKIAIQKRISNQLPPEVQGRHEKAYVANPSKSMFRRGFGNFRRRSRNPQI